MYRVTATELIRGFKPSCSVHACIRLADYRCSFYGVDEEFCSPDYISLYLCKKHRAMVEPKILESDQEEKLILELLPLLFPPQYSSDNLPLNLSAYFIKYLEQKKGVEIYGKNQPRF